MDKERQLVDLNKMRFKKDRDAQDESGRIRKHAMGDGRFWKREEEGRTSGSMDE